MLVILSFSNFYLLLSFFVQFCFYLFLSLSWSIYYYFELAFVYVSVLFSVILLCAFVIFVKFSFIYFSFSDFITKCCNFSTIYSMYISVTIFINILN